MSELSPTRQTALPPHPANRYPGDRCRELHLRLPAYLDGTGAPVTPPLASSLHSSFHCRWCLLELYCGCLGRFRSRGGCGEVLLLGRVPRAAWRAPRHMSFKPTPRLSALSSSRSSNVLIRLEHGEAKSSTEHRIPRERSCRCGVHAGRSVQISVHQTEPRKRKSGLRHAPKWTQVGCARHGA